MAEDAENDDAPRTDWVPTGRRRSTYSPPPAGARYEPDPDPALSGAPLASPALSPQLQEGDRLDSDESDDADTEALGFSPPPRRSLDDSELVQEIQRVDTGTIEQISLLQQELELREADARDFQSWERAMLALGTPEALQAVDQARPAFTGVVPIVPPEAPAGTASPGIDLPPAEDATLEGVLLDDPEPGAASLSRGAGNPPPLVLPPEPHSESDLDRVLRQRWLALDTPVEEPPATSDIRTDPDTGVGPVSTPGSQVLLADVENLSDMWLTSVDTGSLATLHPPGDFPPSGSSRAVERSGAGVERESRDARIFSLERGGVAPTPIEQRNGRAVRLVWLWFGANGSALSVTLGAALFAAGMSLRQGIVAALVGIGLSFVPLGLGTLAGKRSGMPTMVVSRATFGVLGNVVPAVLALLTRLFWGAVFLWLLATSAVEVLAGTLLPSGGDPQVLFLASLAAGLLAASAIAVLGFRLFERIQLVLSILSVLLLATFVALTAQHIDLPNALTVQDGPWVLVLGGAVLVFSVVGLLWAQSTSDLARYQRVRSSGARSMLWSSFGASLPTFALIVWGCLLAASDAALAEGLVTTPFATLTSLLPDWFPVPLLLATVLPLLSALTVTLYSGGLALQSTGVRIARDVGVVASAVVVLALALLFGATVTDMTELIRDVATTIAVPVAAWAGIFCAEMMLRHRQFSPGSLLQRGGAYADYRWVNLSALVVGSVLGFGFTSASLGWLNWQGYLLPLVGMMPDGVLGQADVGVLVALAIGLLTPPLLGVSAVRSQEGGRQ